MHCPKSFLLQGIPSAATAAAAAAEFAIRRRIRLVSLWISRPPFCGDSCGMIFRI